MPVPGPQLCLSVRRLRAAGDRPWDIRLVRTSFSQRFASNFMARSRRPVPLDFAISWPDWSGERPHERGRSLISITRRAEMTSDDASACQHGRWPRCAACRCSREMFAYGPCGQQCATKHAMDASAQDKRLGRAERGPDCHTCMVRGADARNTGIASHVRTKLRTMAGDVFPISRHTADCIANALQDRFLADTEVVLKRILDLAALRYLRDGSSTVTLEDLAIALRSLALPTATRQPCCDRCCWGSAG
jgi:hypothetical protein